MEFDARAVRIFAPDLPAVIGSQFLFCHFHTALHQAFPHHVNIADLQTKMCDVAGRSFEPGFVSFKNFQKLPVIYLHIKPEEFSVSQKVESLFQAECATIKIEGFIQVVRENADMSEGFDH